MSMTATATTVLPVAYVGPSDTPPTPRDSHCLVCYSELTTRAKTPCDHNGICGLCHLRVRSLHEDKSCPICKTQNDKIIVDTDPHRSYHEYPMWGDDIGPGYVFRDDVGMFFQETYYEQEIVALFGFACKLCDYSVETDTTTTPTPSNRRSPFQQLQDHLKKQHRTQLCTLCVDHKRDFVYNLPRMTHNQLQKHLKVGDGTNSGFLGHPGCDFCHPKRFYDLADLHLHLHKQHYKCHICEKMGLDNQYFKDYSSLNRHFERRHFLCLNPQCLEARFVVFETELDLRGHELSVHGGTSTGSNRIHLEFRTRRAGYDGSGLEDENRRLASSSAGAASSSDGDYNFGANGEVFVPQGLPTSAGGGNDTTAANGGSDANGLVQLHPLHIQRTEELRAQAAIIRQQQSLSSQDELFPSLQPPAAAGSSSSGSAPLTGWAAGSGLQRVQNARTQAGRVTEEDFPTLGPSPSARHNAKIKSIKGNVGSQSNLNAARRQFAAMTMSASQVASTPSWTGAGTISGPPSVPANNFSALPAPAAAASTTVNRQANLTADNFPTLAPSPNARIPYTAANNLAKKTQQQQKQKVQTPSIDSTSDFPSMASVNKPSAKNNSVRNRVLGTMDHKKPSLEAKSNILQVPSKSVAISADVTIDEMKASLGPNKFKQLKRFTRELAEGVLPPDAYVDHSAALFDRGYADPDFWSYLPALLDSCPYPELSEQALIYMTSIQSQPPPQPTAAPATRSSVSVASTSKPSAAAVAARAAPSAPTWGNKSTAPPRNVFKAPPPAPVAKSSMLTQVVAPSRPMNMVLPTQKKSAWGGTGTATVVRVKAPPGSVAAAAANQGPQGGSATKFMAKEAKKQAAAALNQNNNAGGKAKKKKQKDELRALAFGK